MNEVDKLIRGFENTNYFGHLFFVEYDGKKFDSFDENPEGKSLKSEFRKLLEMNGLKIFKGIQQAGRTDKDVSAKENILYTQIYLNFHFFQNIFDKNSYFFHLYNSHFLLFQVYLDSGQEEKYFHSKHDFYPFQPLAYFYLENPTP